MISHRLAAWALHLAAQAPFWFVVGEASSGAKLLWRNLWKRSWPEWLKLM